MALGLILFQIIRREEGERERESIFYGRALGLNKFQIMGGGGGGENISGKSLRQHRTLRLVRSSGNRSCQKAGRSYKQ